jgi:hypothetical protein
MRKAVKYATARSKTGMRVESMPDRELDVGVVEA